MCGRWWSPERRAALRAVARRSPGEGSVLGLSATLLRLQGFWGPQHGGRRVASALAAGVSLALSCGLVVMPLLKLLMDRPQELEELATCIFVVVIYSEIFIKLVCFVVKAPTLRELVELLSETGTGNSTGERSDDTRRRYQRLGNRLLLASLGTTTVTVAIWVAPPLVHQVLNTEDGSTSSNNRSLPLAVWLPLDMYASPTYEALYLIQFLSMMSVDIAVVCTDCFFVDLMLRVAAELEILNDNISALRKWKTSATLKNQDKPSECISDLEIHLQISKNVKHHQAVLRSVALLEEAMSTAIFVLFLALIIGICTDIFTATVSERLMLSAYSNAWVDFDTRCRRSLLTFTMVVGQPLEIKVGKMYTLNRGTFLQVS
ncbi:odorant receptor 43a-like [Schistocerca nitens]|uniref:odorant receptor 43a-like n=1 Tax=Schistocerca nitens TaxID=7011 RepID=UPI0021198931|nr:odorant receptor 43a-like [Schistocerca nitens]